jgi:hypothetical protein
MGQYLYISLCYRVEISRSDIDYNRLTESDVLLEMSKKFDLSLYKREDTDELLVFTLRDELLEKELSSFLETQFHYFEQSSYNQEHHRETIQAIKERKTVAEILDLAESKRLPNFQQSVFMDEISVGEWMRYLEIRITNLTFECVGKVFMEEYRSFLVYLVNLIRKVAEGNPMAGAVFASID